VAKQLERDLRPYDAVFGAIPDVLAAELDCTVPMVHSNQPRCHTFLRYLLERVAFWADHPFADSSRRLAV
jgi:hypothetical protein